MLKVSFAGLSLVPSSDPPEIAGKSGRRWNLIFLQVIALLTENIAGRKFMANVANKFPENVPGKYYVDNQCIDCDLCRETAPNNFSRNEEAGHSYVSKQPENAEEEKQCREAKEGCPVEAIGDDGA